MVLIGRELLLIHLIEEQFCTQGSSIADKSTLTVVKLVNLDMLFSDNLTQAQRHKLVEMIKANDNYINQNNKEIK